MTRADVHDRSERTEADPQLIGPGQSGAQQIPVNLYETTESLVLVAPMPAVSAEDVEITRHADRLRVQAHLRSAAPRDYILHEWEYGLYDREIDLPPGFCGPITATLGKGQLAVSVKRGDAPAAAANVTVNPVDA